MHQNNTGPAYQSNCELHFGPWALTPPPPPSRLIHSQYTSFNWSSRSSNIMSFCFSKNKKCLSAVIVTINRKTVFTHITQELDDAFRPVYAHQHDLVVEQNLQSHEHQNLTGATDHFIPNSENFKSTFMNSWRFLMRKKCLNSEWSINPAFILWV